MRGEEENNGSPLKSSSPADSRGFELSHFKKNLKEKLSNFDDGKYSSFRSRLKSPSDIKNKTNSQNKNSNFSNSNNNSFLNFLENNNFVKNNKKNLNKKEIETELIIPISNNVKTNIQKELIFNENQLLLNHEKINKLDAGYF